MLFFSLQNVMSEPFEPSPFMPAVPGGFDNELDPMASRQQKAQDDVTFRMVTNEKESNTKESNVAKIKVVVC